LIWPKKVLSGGLATLIFKTPNSVYWKDKYEEEEGGWNISPLILRIFIGIENNQIAVVSPQSIIRRY
jgi:hypothetical protein